MTATATVLDAHGNPKPPPPPPAPAYISLAAGNQDVAEVLQLLAKPDGPSFADLYKIHEIVEHTGHGKSALGSAGISKLAI
jgi:hypothetical protein